MAFPGTELLEVAPSTYFAVASGGGKVFAVAGGYDSAGGYAAIMDTSTATSLLYSMPIYYGGRWLALQADYQDGRAWVASSSHWDNGHPCMFAYISTSGSTWTSGTWGPSDTLGGNVITVVACGNYVHGSATRDNDWWWGRLDQTTMTAGDVSNGTGVPGGSPIRYAGAVGSTLYDSLGTTTLTAWNDKRDTSGSSWSLPLAPTSAGVTVGTKIWWQASMGMVSFDTATNTSDSVLATPSTGYPASQLRPTVLGEVAYWTHSENKKLVAFHLPSGQWKLDDLVTVRSDRRGVGVGSGKLWIPSTVTPP